MNQEVKRNYSLEDVLRFGLIREVVESKSTEEIINEINNFVEGELLTRFLAANRIDKKEELINLLKVLAKSIGKDLSFSQLAKLTNLNTRSAIRYLTLLEEAEIIFSISGFDGVNEKQTVKVSKKYYFLDLGVRNFFFENFSLLNERKPGDIKQLWENFLVAENQKSGAKNNYFWRDYSGNHIDFLDKENLQAYIFCTLLTTRCNFPRAFIKANPDFQLNVVTPNNCAKFLKVDQKQIKNPFVRSVLEYMI